MIIIEFFKSGGEFMYPIFIVMAIGYAIVIERFIYLSKVSRSITTLWTRITPMLKVNDFARANQVVTEAKGPLASVLAYGFSRFKPGVKRETLEAAMEEGIMEALPELEERTHYLAILANVATLLGLLGTIIGLIQAFTAVAAADPSEKANLLSNSISVAMNTTAFGLIVAIPLLLLHSYLSTRTNKLADTIEIAAIKCSNLMVND